MLMTLGCRIDAVAKTHTVDRHLQLIDSEILTHLNREIRALIWHVVETWYDQVRSSRAPEIPANTNWEEGCCDQFKPSGSLGRQLKTEEAAP